MQITSSAPSILTAYGSKATARTPSLDPPAASDTTATATNGVETADFTHMTRQQLFDWMNGQIKSGKMTFDQSTAFLGMTMKVDATTGQPVDMTTDKTLYDFVDRARQGLAGATSRHDDGEAKLIAQAIAVMQRDQGTVTKVNLTA